MFIEKLYDLCPLLLDILSCMSPEKQETLPKHLVNLVVDYTQWNQRWLKDHSHAKLYPARNTHDDRLECSCWQEVVFHCTYWGCDFSWKDEGCIQQYDLAAGMSCPKVRNPKGILLPLTYCLTSESKTQKEGKNICSILWVMLEILIISWV